MRATTCGRSIWHTHTQQLSAAAHSHVDGSSLGTQQPGQVHRADPEAWRSVHACALRWQWRFTRCHQRDHNWVKNCDLHRWGVFGKHDVRHQVTLTLRNNQFPALCPWDEKEFILSSCISLLVGLPLTVGFLWRGKKSRVWQTAGKVGWDLDSSLQEEGSSSFYSREERKEYKLSLWEKVVHGQLNE